MASSSHSKVPRRFAPLNPSKANSHAAPQLKGIVFDVDGTLCLPQNYMFGEMRSALGIPKSVDILTHIQSLSTEVDQPAHNSKPATSTRDRAKRAIEAIEEHAMTQQTPQPGLTELMSYLDIRGLRKALCTRNFPMPVTHLLETFLQETSFAPIITRETVGVRPKPSPEGLWRIAEHWGLRGDDDVITGRAEDGEADPLELARRHLGAGLIMVGDSVDDVAAGTRAGSATVLLLNEDNEHVVEHERPDLVIRKLDELVRVLDEGFEKKEKKEKEEEEEEEEEEETPNPQGLLGRKNRKDSKPAGEGTQAGYHPVAKNAFEAKKYSSLQEDKT